MVCSLTTEVKLYSRLRIKVLIWSRREQPLIKWQALFMRHLEEPSPGSVSFQAISRVPLYSSPHRKRDTVLRHLTMENSSSLHSRLQSGSVRKTSSVIIKQYSFNNHYVFFYLLFFFFGQQNFLLSTLALSKAFKDCGRKGALTTEFCRYCTVFTATVFPQIEAFVVSHLLFEFRARFSPNQNKRARLNMVI